MSKIRTGIEIIKAVWAYCLGRPINQVNLSFGTVEWDDIKIAIHYLLFPPQESDAKVVKAYETAFSTYNGSKYVFSFLQGRVALSACLHALDLNEGDKIVVPAYTCVGVANACWMHKLDIEFCDIELDTYGLSFHDFREIIASSPGVRAVIVQHLFGLVCRDFQQILDYCKEKSIYVIEDCAHATGAIFKEKRVGNYGDVAFFSSEQSKVFNTLTGGLAISNNGGIADRIAHFQRNCTAPTAKEKRAMLAHFIHGYYKLKHPYRAVWGPIAGILLRSMKKGKAFVKETISRTPSQDYARRLPSSLAAIGINQLKKLPRFAERRKQEVEKWKSWCRLKKIDLPTVIPSSHPTFLRYPVLVDSTLKQNKTWATSLQVDIGVWFVSYLHPIEYEIKGCPNAKKAIQSCVNFPTLTF